MGPGHFPFPGVHDHPLPTAAPCVPVLVAVDRGARSPSPSSWRPSVSAGWAPTSAGARSSARPSPAAPLRQPANTLSNLGFVLAGLAVGWYAGLPRGRLARRGLATTYAVVVVLLGPGSMAMHATQSELGGRLDQLSMYLVAGFAAAYAGIRLAGRGAGTFVVALVALVALCDAHRPGRDRSRWSTTPATRRSRSCSWWPWSSRAGYAAAPTARRASRGSARALATMAVAFAVWTLSRSGAPLCDPHSWVQGHAVWHLLCAVAAYCLYRYWTTEPRAGRRVRRGRSRPCSRRRRRSSRRTRW